ncbi:hypothetical protein T492DRAFT_895594 [Pavlovales sp. CCMP2436]|nr:hypothetical protein T492DRAFT_895594 [Pavlovales sp. CCMP2436]
MDAVAQMHQLPPPRAWIVPAPRPKPRVSSPRAVQAGGVRPAGPGSGWRSGPKPPAELEHEIRLRVAREKLAFETALALTEPGVSIDQMLEAAPYMHSTHYDHVLEERGSASLCGYPCCRGALKALRPRQQFVLLHVPSGPSKKLLDARETPHFCSAECARASAAYARSLLLEPVAMRDTVGPNLQRKLQPQRIAPGVLVGDVIDRTAARRVAFATVAAE